MPTPRVTLVCFAVKEEAKSFEHATREQKNIKILLTGMGKRNAQRAIHSVLEEQRPDLVISSGFAGGLRSGLASGTVVFAADQTTGLASSILAAGACPVRFVCSDRVAATAAEKAALWNSTGADAVEMESEVICGFCRERQIPSATVRVILDNADEDLPLDFNEFMTADQRLDRRRLALAIIKSPTRISSLLRLQKQSVAAATRLSQVLLKVLTD